MAVVTKGLGYRNRTDMDLLSVSSSYHLLSR